MNFGTPGRIRRPCIVVLKEIILDEVLITSRLTRPLTRQLIGHMLGSHVPKCWPAIAVVRRNVRPIECHRDFVIGASRKCVPDPPLRISSGSRRGEIVTLLGKRRRCYHAAA